LKFRTSFLGWWINFKKKEVGDIYYGMALVKRK
jgi:hypothetical protein